MYNINKTLSMKIIIMLLILLSCNTRIHGPNYNSGKTHNQSLNNRNKVVLKEDARMKHLMKKTRMRASKEHRQIQRTRNKVKRRLIR